MCPNFLLAVTWLCNNSLLIYLIMRDSVYMKWSNNFPLNYETLLGASDENSRKTKGKINYTLYKMHILSSCLTVIATMHKCIIFLRMLRFLISCDF